MLLQVTRALPPYGCQTDCSKQTAVESTIVKNHHHHHFRALLGQKKTVDETTGRAKMLLKIETLANLHVAELLCCF